MSALEDRLLLQVRAACLPLPEREARLIPGRKFRADFYWPVARLVVELDGGTFVQGRHSRGLGQASDCEKHNLLTLAGYRVLRVTTPHVASGAALDWIASALNAPYGLGLQDADAGEPQKPALAAPLDAPVTIPPPHKRKPVARRSSFLRPARGLPVAANSLTVSPDLED